MPNYSYRCEKCRENFERTETMPEHEAAKAKCPKCRLYPKAEAVPP
jgi:putative FmdB family regulatory protein